MKDQPSMIIPPGEMDIGPLKDRPVAVIGYGNQGRAQALNLRDSGVKVIVGNRDDGHRAQAVLDGFDVLEIPAAVRHADVVMLLIADEVLPPVYETQIAPHLHPEGVLVFASGYSVAFDQVQIPTQVDALLLAPRMIGVGVRERYLSGEGFYCFLGVHQDASGSARKTLLALAAAIGGLKKPAIEVTCEQEATLDLFNEQAFGPAFGRVLLLAIDVLLEMGLPPEAVLVEMYLSEEMAYTYRKMAGVGLVRQTFFHSRTSQYGAMSRGTRFLNLGLRGRMRDIYRDIESGAFAREWSSPLAQLRFKVIKFFAMRQSINKVEGRVRQALGLVDQELYQPPSEIDVLLDDPRIKAELETFEGTFEF